MIKEYLPYVATLISGALASILSIWAAKKIKRKEDEAAVEVAEIVDRGHITTELWAEIERSRATIVKLTEDLAKEKQNNLDLQLEIARLKIEMDSLKKQFENLGPWSPLCRESGCWAFGKGQSILGE